MFRKSPRGGQPEELWETDFDVICPQIPHQGHVLIAETLRVMMEIMDSFEEQLGPYYIRVRPPHLLARVVWLWLLTL